MPKKPEETKKPTHGPKPCKGLHTLKKPGEQKTRPERDCTMCEYATQTVRMMVSSVRVKV